jgi:hypothetical protein
MNHLEMTKCIKERLSFIENQNKENLKTVERMRKQFVADYPVKKIKDLTLDEYVIGKGSDNLSFCYRLERKLDSLGRILGAQANKFGIYYGVTNSDETKKYRFAQHWGKSKNKVFDAVKKAITELLVAASDDDMEAIRNNKISPMFKGKLLYLYFPEKFAPIYSKRHLENFLAELNIGGDFKTEADMQKALMDYRLKWPELKQRHSCLYMWFLYDIFGYPETSPTNESVVGVTMPLLSIAVDGAAIITEMPSVGSKSNKMNGSCSGSGDYDSQQKRNKQIGDRGEAIVLAMEKQRLIKARRADLVKKINHVAEHDDSAGFDILSFENDGSDRPIEVKATSGKSLERGFFISANEVTKASTMSNYHIYFVFSALSSSPRVLQLKNPLSNETIFELTPTTFLAKIKHN